MKPQTKIGEWSVGLNIVFLAVILISILLVKVFKVLSFDDTWWNITVNIFLASIISFILGLRAIIKYKDKSVLVFISTVIGLLSVLFILLHSLFIRD